MRTTPLKHAEVEIEVRYAETDQMGVVHHANWIVWLELARTRLCLDAGFHYSEIEKQGLLLLVTRVEVSYRGAARYGESVVVSCWVQAVGSRAVTFGYHVRRGEALLATAITEHVWVDAESRRPRRFPDASKGPFEAFIPRPAGKESGAVD